MGNITKLNNILCYDINAIDGVNTSDIVKWDANEFCVSPTPTPTPSVTPTPTPTPGGVTPTPTPTPAPCDVGCCYTELCYSSNDCREACQCNDVRGVYLSQPCYLDPCELAYSIGIYDDAGCTQQSVEGYYSDVGTCYLWQSGILTLQGTC